jgi:hypothetical protein
MIDSDLVRMLDTFFLTEMPEMIEQFNMKDTQALLEAVAPYYACLTYDPRLI